MRWLVHLVARTSAFCSVIQECWWIDAGTGLRRREEDTASMDSKEDPNPQQNQRSVVAFPTHSKILIICKIKVCMTLARIFPLGSLDYSKPTTVFLMVETGTLYEVGEKSEVSPEETRKNFSCSIDHTHLLRSLLDHGSIVKPKGSRVRSGFKFKLCNPLSCNLEGLTLISSPHSLKTRVNSAPHPSKSTLQNV